MKSYYSKELMDRFLNPKYFGEMKNPDGVSKVGNPRCGDQMTVYLKIKNGKIEDASFQTLGCAAAIAISDLVCEMVIDRSLEEACLLTEKEMIKELKDLPSVKIHCSSLSIKGVKEAIEDYEKRK